MDFPAILDGRKVVLCWKLGESEVAHWHEWRAGVAGRKPIDAEFRHHARQPQSVDPRKRGSG